MSFWDWLPTNWGELCRNADTSRFAWAHNGANKNGWIELHENGRVTTSWCEGSWKAVESDADVIEVTFGSCKHMCRFRTGGFEVEQRISKKRHQQFRNQPNQQRIMTTSSRQLQEGSSKIFLLPKLLMA